MEESATTNKAGNNFLRSIITEDLRSAEVETLVTRFPPEPNGYLHIGHAKSISVNFGLAEEFSGVCRLRFDDTNPEKESQEYIDAIQEDVRWLGYQWEGDVRFASSYFPQLYQWAVYLVEHSLAYVDDLTPEEAREYRGTLTEPGRNSPFRDRSIEENLDLLRRMRAGEFEDGARVLRAKIDMGHPNMNMRDPILYRIRHAHHHQTGFVGHQKQRQETGEDQHELNRGRAVFVCPKAAKKLQKHIQALLTGSAAAERSPPRSNQTH